MGSFDGVVLVSDFDGTLIDADLQVSEENIQAIHSFIERGGRFAGATGRTEVNVRPFSSKLPLHLPWILYNGAVIYDLENNVFVYRSSLNQPLARAFTEKVLQSGATTNVQVYTGRPYVQVNTGPSPMPKPFLRDNVLKKNPWIRWKGRG